MRTKQTRLAGAVAAIIAAGLAGFSLRPASTSPTVIAARNPAVEVRTVVIRKTIHIVRHERSAHGTRGRGRPSAAPANGAGGPSHPVAAGGVPVATRTSPSHATVAASAGPGTSASSGSPATPVTTRTSASHTAPSTTGAPAASGGGSTSAPVTTRTSTGGKAGSTSSGGGSGSSGKPVSTRTSGGHGGDGEKGDNGGD